MSFVEDLQQATQRTMRDLQDWLRPAQAEGEPLPISMAQAILDYDRFSDLLYFRDMEDNNIVVSDDGKTLRMGFMLQLSPLLIAGSDAEPQIEAAIQACPAGAVLQFSAFSTPNVVDHLDSWVRCRTKDCQSPLLAELTEKRSEFLEASAAGIMSVLPQTKLYPRSVYYFLTVNLPFTGGRLDSDVDLNAFRQYTDEVRTTIIGALEGSLIYSRSLTRNDLGLVMRGLLNPHYTPRYLRDTSLAARDEDLPFIDRTTRVRVSNDGNIVFSGAENPREVHVACITTDALPNTAWLPQTAELLGKPESREDRIACPFWVYTTIEVLPADDSRETLNAKLGLLNKQTASESPWFRSMMAHMYEQRDAVHYLMEQTRRGHTLVRAYVGINLYSTEDNVRRDVEYVKGLWRRAGFRASEERYISLPIFLASLPFNYTPAMSPPGKGLYRMQTVHSLNAAALAVIQGDWAGSSPSSAGPLLLSRRGQLANFNLMESTTNYNFVIVAASGSGKSFFANEIVTDFLAKRGMVRILDVGRSYFRFCELVGGRSMVFDPQNPISLNPFTGIDTVQELAELMPLMKTLIRQMAFPVTSAELTPAFEYQAIEAAITASWELYRGDTELRHVYEWLAQHHDPRAQDLAFQLIPFATGRYAPWFSGKRQLAFDNDFVVVELEELKNDPEMQAVVLSLCIHEITREMYLSSREIPKLLAIDEAWDLLGNGKAASFIETAFRRARKYNGVAGVITQSFEDFGKSAATKAALDNAAWQFVLYQRPESLQYAATTKQIVTDEYRLNLLKTVQSGDGFSEVFVRSDRGEGVYRFVVDRHSYYVYTSRATDITRIDALRRSGRTLLQSIDDLARADYRRMYGWEPSPLKHDTPDMDNTINHIVQLASAMHKQPTFILDRGDIQSSDVVSESDVAIPWTEGIARAMPGPKRRRAYVGVVRQPTS